MEKLKPNVVHVFSPDTAETQKAFECFFLQCSASSHAPLSLPAPTRPLKAGNFSFRRLQVRPGACPENCPKSVQSEKGSECPSFRHAIPRSKRHLKACAILCYFNSAPRWTHESMTAPAVTSRLGGSVRVTPVCSYSVWKVRSQQIDGPFLHELSSRTFG